MLPHRRLPLVGIAAVCLFTNLAVQPIFAQDTVPLGSVQLSPTSNPNTPRPVEGIASQAAARDLNSAPRGGTGPIGACCFGVGCLPLEEEACTVEGLTWLGPDTDCADCPSVPECPPDTIFGQPPSAPFGSAGAGTSELTANIQRYENFGGVGGSVVALTWYGFDLELLPNGMWEECEEFDNTFEISFHPNLSNRPGPAVCTYTVTATRTPTNLRYDAANIVGGTGAELSVYEATLPTPCTITNGFVSIVGLGSTSCWFLWTDPPGTFGDDFSVCVGCIDEAPQLDHAVCLQGTLGGITGACCDEATLACVNDVEILDCRSTGQRFVPDTTCENLDPPCGAEVGACCDDFQGFGMGCVDGVLKQDCDSELRFEINQACQFINPLCGEPTGACCFGASDCFILTQDDCESEDLNWLGADTTCAECPPLPECAPEAIFSQAVADIIFEPSAFTSEIGSGFEIFENFSGVPGPITSLRFFGFDLQPMGNGFIECDESDPTFIITFYADEAGAPGTVLCQHTVLSTRTPTGFTLLNAELNTYDATLPDPCITTNGWVSILGLGNPNCYFLWIESPDGDNRSVQTINQLGQTFINSNDFALCLNGFIGGVTGACCNDVTGNCESNVSIENCIGTNQRFEPGATCASLPAACGQPRGACCFEVLECLFIDEVGCTELGGNWLGSDQPCLTCPCVIPCPDNGIPEGELACFTDYEDMFNPGCDADPPTFAPVSIGQTICGTTGIYSLNGQNVGDEDWFAITLDNFDRLGVQLIAEGTMVLSVLDSSVGCPGSPIFEELVRPCEPTSFSGFFGAGTYWIGVQPAGIGELPGCGAPYTLIVGGLASCDGDVQFDNDLDMADFATMQNDFGNTGMGLIFDLDRDGDVDIADVNIITPLIALPCP